MDKEHELLALKARKARIFNGLPGPKKLVWNEENAQTITELCEVESRIAQLEGRNPLEIYKIVPNSEQPDDALHELMAQTDNVDHPSHYTSGGIECIDAMKAMLAGYEQAKIATKFYWHFLSGQVLKYLWRWPLKERPLQDLKKARWYLDRLIDDVEKQDHAVTELHSDTGKGISE